MSLLQSQNDRDSRCRIRKDKNVIVERRKYTKTEWLAEGKRRFGTNFEDYKFVCPRCGRVNTGKEFREAGAEPNAMYCECIGRYDESKGCDWAAYGLFDICTVEVDGQPVFDFADTETKSVTISCPHCKVSFDVAVTAGEKSTYCCPKCKAKI